MQPGGQLIYAGLILLYESPTATDIPADAARPLPLEWTDSQNVTVPSLLGGLLPSFINFALPTSAAEAALTAVGLSTAATAANTSIMYNDCEIIFQTCSSAWLQDANILSTPAGVRSCHERQILHQHKVISTSGQAAVLLPMHCLRMSFAVWWTLQDAFSQTCSADSQSW